MVKNSPSTLIVLFLAAFSGPIFSMAHAQPEERIFVAMKQRFDALFSEFIAEKEFQKSIDTAAEKAYDLYLDLSAFQVTTQSDKLKRLATTYIQNLKDLIETIKSNVAKVYQKREGYTQPPKALKKEASRVLKSLHLEHKVIFMISTTRSKSDWCVHQSEYNTYHYLLVYNPESDFNKYDHTDHLFSMYHELGHIIHDDLGETKRAQNRAMRCYATAAGSLIGTAIGALILLKTDNKFDLVAGLAAPLLLGYSADGIAKSSIEQKQEYAADLFAYKALLKENNIQAIIAAFLWFIEDYRKRTVLSWFDHFSSHPSSLKRAQAILNFLQKHTLDLLALPIPAKDAKKFNAYLKQYFPDVYAQCIGQYA